VAAVADFIGNQRSGLADGAAHFDEYFHNVAALGAFYLHKPGCSLAFLAAADEHNPTSRIIFFILSQKKKNEKKKFLTLTIRHGLY
jgi:hypothetical protein